VCSGLAVTYVNAQQPSFTVKDDIAMTRISDPRPRPSVPGSELVWPSPDGRWAAIVTSRGQLSDDKIESRLLVFDLNFAAAIFNQRDSILKPRMIASVTAYPYHLENDGYDPVIKDVRWSDDSGALYFRAVDARGKYQLCSAPVQGGRVRTLSPEDKDVGQFDVVGTNAVFSAADPGTHLIDPGQPINRDAINITGARIQEILFPDDVAARATELFRLYTSKLTQTNVTVQRAQSYQLLDIPYLSAVYPFRTSPNATKLLKLEPPSSLPDSWANYNPAPRAEYARLTPGIDSRLLRADNTLRPLEYTLIDLASGQRTPLLQSPNARSFGYLSDANRIAWSEDGRRVVVTNTFLPLEAGRDEKSYTFPCAAASVDLPDHKARCLYFESGTPDSHAVHIEDVSFGKGKDEIVLLMGRSSGDQTIRNYALRNGIWSLDSSRSLSKRIRSLSGLEPTHRGEAQSITLFVHQTLNDPPTIWGKNASGDSRELWNPNPQFSNMQFGEASPYQWKDDTGRAWSGILVKPVGYVAGQRYPLVLQLYDYVDGQFVTDGLFPTAFAARELASAGMIVLQIRKQPNRVSEDDPQIHLEAYRSAIKHLADDGVADRNRVGVVGFSWTCWAAVEALIRDPTLFAAATIADGLDNSYMQYKLFTVAFYPLQRQIDKIRGGGPFTTNLQHWVDEAPGFHLDRVQTPVRIEAINPSSVLQEWELYASLQLQRKPVDFIYFPSGTHIHQRPLERLESQQGNVDWMRFWLKDEEDPDPSKQVQYERWRQLKQARADQNTQHLTPKP
jgi:dipeptidyl aminopeptidase/acylaminoacyl peptidase